MTDDSKLVSIISSNVKLMELSYFIDDRNVGVVGY